MMQVQLVNDLESGMKLYYAGKVWDVSCVASSGMYDFAIKNGTDTLYLDRVWTSVYGKGAFTFRVCQPGGEFVCRMYPHNFNKVVSKKG